MSCDAIDLARFRPYLAFLARVSFDQRLQAQLDASDIVQQTLLLAHRNSHQFAGSTDAELAAWLRQILVNVVAEYQRKMHRDKRSLLRERPFEQVLNESSRRMARFACSDPSPSQQYDFNERALRLALAMEQLSRQHRDVLVLHYWQGHSIPEIAAILRRSPSAVGGLVHRALKKLRDELADLR